MNWKLINKYFSKLDDMNQKTMRYFKFKILYTKCSKLN